MPLTDAKRRQLNELALVYRRLPHLHRLLIGLRPLAGSHEVVRHLRGELPGITVLPTHYHAGRAQFPLLVLLPLGFGIGLVLLQTIAQLSGPQSVFVPGYRSVHLKSAAAAVVAMMAVTAASASIRGIHWSVVPAITTVPTALLLEILTFFWSGAFEQRKERSWILSRQARGLRVVGVVAMIWLSVFAPSFRPQFDWFLSGEQPILAAFTAIAGGAGLVAAARRLLHLHRQQAEVGLPPAIAAVDIFRTQHLRLNQNSNRSHAERSHVSWSRRLAVCVETRSDGTGRIRRAWATMRLWLLGSHSAELPMLLVLYAIIGTLVVGFEPIREGRISDLPEVLLDSSMISVLPYVATFWLGILLWQRSQLFGVEVLQPVSRSAWVDRTLGSLWLLPALLYGISWLFVTGLRYLADELLSAPWTIVEFVAIVASATLCVAIVAWIVAVRRVWFSLVGLFGLSAASIGLFDIAALRDQDLPFPAVLGDAAVIGPAVACLLIVGLAMLAAARRYWMRMELAQ